MAQLVVLLVKLAPIGDADDNDGFESITLIEPGALLGSKQLHWTWLRAEP